MLNYQRVHDDETWFKRIVYLDYNDLTASPLRPHWNDGDCEGNHPRMGELFR